MENEQSERLQGYVGISEKYQPIRYKWVSESGACARCQELDGTIYYSTEDIPQRPHPNCKCNIDIIEAKDTTPSGIFAYGEIFEKYNKKMDGIALKNDLLIQEIDDCMRKIDNQSEKIEELEKSLNMEEMPPQVPQEIQKMKNQNAQMQNDIQKKKNTALELKKEMENYKNVCLKGSKRDFEKYPQHKEKIEEFSDKLERLYDDLDNIGKELLDFTVEKIGKRLEEAAALWKLSSSKFKEGTDYIEKNGKLYDKIQDLPNSRLQGTVRRKMQSQVKMNDSRGIVLRPDSSMAQAVRQSNTFRNFVKNPQNFRKLMNKDIIGGRRLPNQSLAFNPALSSNTWDLYLGLHHADILDVYVDRNGTLHAKILDTYDFNPGEWWNLPVVAARHYQLEEKIENYYTVIELEIPEEEWMNY